MQNDSKRQIYLDALRAVAIFFVLFNHTGTKGFFLFSVTPISMQYWIYLILSIFCKIAVPLFFMISGVLLIPKDDTMRTLSRRVLRYVIVILVCSFFWYIIYVRNDVEVFSVASFFKRVYSDKMIIPYWFLYSYLSVLLMLPLIRRLILNMRKSDFIYMFIMYIFFTSIVPVFQYLVFDNAIRLNTDINIPIITFTPIFYLCMGYYVHNFVDMNKIKTFIAISWIVGVIGIGLACILTYYNAVKTGICDEKSSQLFHSTFISVPTIAVFCTIKYLFEQISISNSIEKIIISFSSCVFGIYLVEQYLREKIMPICYNTLTFLSPLVLCFVSIVCVMVVGYIIISILRMIPIIRKFI